jgi:hypothetical protein
MLQSFREIFQTLNLDKRVVAIETRACPEPRPERFISVHPPAQIVHSAVTLWNLVSKPAVPLGLALSENGAVSERKEDKAYAEAWARWKKRVADELEAVVHYDDGASCDVFVDLMIDGTVHIVTLDALVDALEEAKRVGRTTDCPIRCITVASRTPN